MFSRRIDIVDGIVLAVGVPVVAVKRGVTGQEPARASVVEPVSQSHEFAVNVVLVTVLPPMPERSLDARSGDEQAERAHLASGRQSAAPRRENTGRSHRVRMVGASR